MSEPIAKFITKSGKEIELHLPSLERTKALLEFINRLTDEDTFLSLTGNHKTYHEEENWIKNTITNMKAGQSVVVWAIYNDKIVGSCDIHRGGTRDFHAGKIGLMVDVDFRRDGIGSFLVEYILRKAKRMEIKIAVLDAFSDNTVAIALYEKKGFKEFARLPNGLFRKGKYSDEIKMYKELTTSNPSLERRGNDE